MKDPLSFTKRLTIVAVIIVLIIIIGMITMYHPKLKYVLSTEEILTEILKLEDEIYPDEVLEITMDSIEGYRIIDLRNPYKYGQGHISTAINIPETELLRDQNLDLFDKFQQDSIQIILYGNDQREANGPWTLLKQLGYTNIKVLLGGYNYYIDQPDLYDLPDIPEYLVEEPLYNFAEIIKNGSKSQVLDTQEGEPEMIIPKRKKKESVVEGGC